jgi:hypothetical protein
MQVKIFVTGIGSNTSPDFISHWIPIAPIRVSSLSHFGHCIPSNYLIYYIIFCGITWKATKQSISVCRYDMTNNVSISTARCPYTKQQSSRVAFTNMLVPLIEAVSVRYVEGLEENILQFLITLELDRTDY